MTEAQGTEILTLLQDVLDAMGILTLWVAGVVLGLGVLWGIATWKLMQQAAKAKTPLALLLCVSLCGVSRADYSDTFDTGITCDSLTLRINSTFTLNSGVYRYTITEELVDGNDSVVKSRSVQTRTFDGGGDFVFWSTDQIPSWDNSAAGKAAYDSRFSGHTCQDLLDYFTASSTAYGDGIDTSLGEQGVRDFVSGVADPPPGDADGDGYTEDVDPDDNDPNAIPKVDGWGFTGVGSEIEDPDTGQVIGTWFYTTPDGTLLRVFYDDDTGEVLGWSTHDGQGNTIDYGDGDYPGRPSVTSFPYDGNTPDGGGSSQSFGQGFDRPNEDPDAGTVDWPDDLAGVGEAIEQLRESNVEAASDLYAMLREIARRESEGTDKIVDAIEGSGSGTGTDFGEAPSDGTAEAGVLENVFDLEGLGLVAPSSIFPEAGTVFDAAALNVNLPGGTTTQLAFGFIPDAQFGSLDASRQMLRHLVLFGYAVFLAQKFIRHVLRG